MMLYGLFGKFKIIKTSIGQMRRGRGGKHRFCIWTRTMTNSSQIKKYLLRNSNETNSLSAKQYAEVKKERQIITLMQYDTSLQQL
jgi:hypothetical protein